MSEGRPYSGVVRFTGSQPDKTTHHSEGHARAESHKRQQPIGVCPSLCSQWLRSPRTSNQDVSINSELSLLAGITRERAQIRAEQATLSPKDRDLHLLLPHARRVWLGFSETCGEEVA